MTDERYQDLPRAQRRRLTAWAALRSVLVAAVLIVLYYVLPLDRPWDSGTAERLLIGLLVFAGVMVWDVRIIAGSRYPGVRAAEAVALILPFFLLLFASTYFEMERASAANFTQPLTRTDALYFTVTVFTTVGFGEARAGPGRQAGRIGPFVTLRPAAETSPSHRDSAPCPGEARSPPSEFD
jgi:voltage-gated potassium channel